MEIQIVAKETVSCIYINYSDITFDNIVLSTIDNKQKWNGKMIPADNYIEETAMLTFDNKEILPGEYILSIDYQGCIGVRPTQGFYSCIDPNYKSNSTFNLNR